MRLVLQSSLFPAVLTVLFVGMSLTNAHAYLDAGTGSMILQLLLGGVAGLAIAGKLYWYRFLAFLGFKSKAKEAEREQDSLAEGKARIDR